MSTRISETCSCGATFEIETKGANGFNSVKNFRADHAICRAAKAAQEPTEDRTWDRDRIAYMFGHLTALFNPDDPHHADSGDLAADEMQAMGFTGPERMLTEILAEHVHGNYQWTGEGEDLRRRIERGEV